MESRAIEDYSVQVGQCEDQEMQGCVDQGC